MNRFTAISRSLIVASIAAGALISLTAFAAASPKQPPVSGDDRATAYPGNVVEQDCPTLFPGSSAVPQSEIEFTGGDDARALDITAVPDDVEITGVIVKGGPAYNVYEAESLGALPWIDLHAPLVPSGKPADISHWFVCGVEKPTTTTTTTTTATTTTTSESEQPGGPTETTTSDDVAPAAEDEELAATGVAAGPLVALGAAMLLGGGALLLLRRSAARR